MVEGLQRHPPRRPALPHQPGRVLPFGQLRGASQGRLDQAGYGARGQARGGAIERLAVGHFGGALEIDAATRANLDDWTWLMMLSIALVACDVAARSQYRTIRPSAENIPNF